jgi:hypothetical protein
MLVTSGQTCAGQPLTADSPRELLGLGLVSAGGMLVHCFTFVQSPVIPVLRVTERHNRSTISNAQQHLVHQLALGVAMAEHVSSTA